MKIQAIKQGQQVVMLAGGLVLQTATPKPTELQKSLARRAGIGKMAVTLE
ncbi:MAG TPA: hypothetical protein VIY66_03780 [Candidatus Acidoferrales bacterium]